MEPPLRGGGLRLPGLRRWRLRRGLTQQRLAERAGLDQRQLTKIETDRRGCNPSAAQRLAEGAGNPRRAAREAELLLMGTPERGSIWSGRLRYEAAFVYLRPPRNVLDDNIARRTVSIVRGGLVEAQGLLAQEAAGSPPNPSVREAVGVKEMMLLAAGATTREEVRKRIYVRTRRLARRQMRWFDKLVRSLGEDRFVVAETPAEARSVASKSHIMHDIIGT